MGLCKNSAPISVLLTTQSHSPELEEDEGAPGTALIPACSHSQLSRAAAISGSLLAALGGKQTELPALQWDGKFYLLGLALSQFSSYEIPCEALIFHAYSSWVSCFPRDRKAAAGENLPAPCYSLPWSIAVMGAFPPPAALCQQLIPVPSGQPPAALSPGSREH